MTLAPGFIDATRDAERAVRAILTAMSRPGTKVDIAVPSPADGLSPAAAAALLTLCDGDTPVWLDPAVAGAASWIRFHCGAPLTRDRQAARFAVVGDPGMLPPLDGFASAPTSIPIARPR